MKTIKLLKKLVVKFEDSRKLDRTIEVKYKEYKNSEKIYLYTSRRKNVLEKVIGERRSSRTFSNKTINFSIFSRILSGACGKTENSIKRNYPSAGATYPLEVYIINNTIRGIKKGLYHYNIKDNSLELLKNEEQSLKLEGKIVNFFIKANVIFVTCRLKRIDQYYGLGSVQLVLLEAGHLVHNICLLSTNFGIKQCPVSGFDANKISKFLELDKGEFPIYAVALGK